MPQDKRLIITKAVVHKAQRNSGSPEAAERVPVFLDFVVPAILLQRDASMLERVFAISHSVFPKNGKTTVLIVPKVIALDCSKINKRHGYFDAVVAAEAICKRGDEESEKRALQVARCFSEFIVDARIVSKLPLCISDACRTAAATAAGGTSHSTKTLTSLTGLEEREGLAARLATMAKGGKIRTSTHHGQCSFRVGHAGMTAGDISENAKNFIFAIKQEFPHVWKFVEEFKLSTPVTESIRFMEVGIHK